MLGGFVLVMGGLSFEKTYPVYVDFDNPGGLLVRRRRARRRREGRQRQGAAVPRAAGRPEDRDAGSSSARRSPSSRRVKDSIHAGRGLLRDGAGRARRAVPRDRPGQPGEAGPRRGREVKGIDPPRLDLFLAKAYELLDTTVDGIKNNRETLGDILDNTSGLLKGTEPHRHRQPRAHRAHARERRGHHRSRPSS